MRRGGTLILRIRLRQWLGGLPQWLTFSSSNDHIWFPELRSSHCSCIQMPLNIESTQAADRVLFHASAGRVANNPDNSIKKIAIRVGFNASHRPSLNCRVRKVSFCQHGCGGEVTQPAPNTQRENHLDAVAGLHNFKQESSMWQLRDGIHPGCFKRFVTDWVLSEVSAGGKTSTNCTVSVHGEGEAMLVSSDTFLFNYLKMRRCQA